MCAARARSWRSPCRTPVSAWRGPSGPLAQCVRAGRCADSAPLWRHRTWPRIDAPHHAMLDGDVNVASKIGKAPPSPCASQRSFAGCVLARVDANAAAGQGNQRLVLMIDDRRESARDQRRARWCGFGLKCATETRQATVSNWRAVSAQPHSARYQSAGRHRLGCAHRAQHRRCRRHSCDHPFDRRQSSARIVVRRFANTWSNPPTGTCSRPLRFASRARQKLRSRQTRRPST